MILLLLAAIVSVFFSEDKPLTLFGGSAGIAGTLAFVVMYFFASQTRPVGRALAPMKILFLSAAILTFFQYFSLFDVGKGIIPILGLQELAMFLAVLSVFLIGRGAFGLLPDLALLAAFLGVLVLENSGAAWMVLFAGLCASLFMSLWNRVRLKETLSIKRLLLPLVIAMAALIFLLSPTILRQSQARQLELGTAYSWSIAFQAVTDNIKQAFFGLGPGTSRIAISLYKPAEFNQTPVWQTRFEELSNHATTITAAMGLLGAFAWFFLFGVFLLFAFFLRSPFFAAGVALLAAEFVFLGSLLLLFTAATVLGLGAATFEKVNYPMVLSLKRFFEVNLAFRFLSFLLAVGFIAALNFSVNSIRAEMRFQKAKQTNDLELGLSAKKLNPGHTDYMIFAGTRSFELAKSAAETSSADSATKSLLSFQVQEAIDMLQSATLISPKRVEAWEALGKVYEEISFAKGALDWAVLAFQRARDLEPTNPLLYTKESSLLIKKENLLEARKAIDKALSLKPDLKEALLENALLLEKEGKAGEALKVMKELAFRVPQDTKVLVQLGRLYFNRNDISKAVEQFKQVLLLDPRNSDAHFSLALALEKQGKIKEAIKELELVLDLNPEREEVRLKLEELKKK